MLHEMPLCHCVCIGQYLTARVPGGADVMASLTVTTSLLLWLSVSKRVISFVDTSSSYSGIMGKVSLVRRSRKKVPTRSVTSAIQSRESGVFQLRRTNVTLPDTAVLLPQYQVHTTTQKYRTGVVSRQHRHVSRSLRA